MVLTITSKGFSRSKSFFVTSNFLPITFFAILRILLSDVMNKGKPFFEPTVNYIISSPVVAIVLEGQNAIQVVRSMMGKTNPAEASPGTIRGDFGQMIGRNIIHGSDGPDTASFEISLWFSQKEISSFTRIDEEWLIE